MFGSRISSSIVKVALGATAALTLALCVTTTPASAYSIYNSGYPGKAQTPFTYGYSTFFNTATIVAPYRWVTESAAYAQYDQYVCVTVNLMTASGARYWLDDSSQTDCQWIPAAMGSVPVTGAQFDNLLGGNVAAYSVNVVVTWQLSNGEQIGSSTFDYDQASDYRCQTAYCMVKTTTWGGGAYLTFTR